MASRLAYPEVRAALAASARNHDITEAELDAAEHAQAAGCRVAPAKLDEQP